MKSKDEILDAVHERTNEFRETFGGEQFFENGMIRSLEAMYRLSEIYFGQECASQGFDLMVSRAFQRKDASTSWRDVLDEDFGGIYSETELGNLVHDMTAYANYGIILGNARDDEQRRQVLAAQIEITKDLLNLLPSEFWGLDDEWLVIVLRKAQARWKLDNSEPLSAKELAALSGRALQTIKNKLSGETKEIHGSQVRIEAGEAAAWLSVQKDYNESIWKEQDDTESIIVSDKGMGAVVFVPVAKDGSFFHPGLCRDGKYMIDGEGSEREFEDFESALAALQKMHFPQWRRSTPEGRWTRVRGVDWRRMPMESLRHA